MHDKANRPRQIAEPFLIRRQHRTKFKRMDHDKVISQFEKLER